MSELSKSAVRVLITDVGTGSAFLVASVRLPADAAEAARSTYSCIAQYLADRGTAMVHERIFGSLSAESAVMAMRNCMLQSQGISAENPVTYIQGHRRAKDSRGCSSMRLPLTNQERRPGQLWMMISPAAGAGNSTG